MSVQSLTIAATTITNSISSLRPKRPRLYGQYGGSSLGGFSQSQMMGNDNHHYSHHQGHTSADDADVDAIVDDELEWGGFDNSFQPALERSDVSIDVDEHNAHHDDVHDHDPEFQNFEDIHITSSTVEDDYMYVSAENMSEYYVEDVEVGDGTSNSASGQRVDYPLSIIERYGLSHIFLEYFQRQRNVQSLYQWQHELLSLDTVIQGHNLIYSLPTSGGKTLIAEILLLRSVLVWQKKAILVLPYVSLVEEKKVALEPLGDEFDFIVEGYFSSHGMIPPAPGNVVCVATIEKANSLINSLIEENRVQEIGCVIVDELHMIGDGERGSVLECLLTKLRYCQRYMDNLGAIQLVGMSATIPNVKDLADWLEAELYVSDFRPVPLSEFLKGPDNKIYDKHREIVRDLPPARNGDRDNVVTLCSEVIPDGSVLIFCSTRRNCEIVAQHVAKFLSDEFLQLQKERKIELIADLKNINPDIDDALIRSIPKGVAYHHSGFTSEERALIEEAYRERVLCVLTATSTLAAGVNLPAARVIFRTPYIARDFLEKGRYTQMCGRAGRAGIDEFGESYLMVTQHRGELERGFDLMNRALAPITSALQISVIRRLVLELICSGLIKDLEDAQHFAQLSFYKLCSLRHGSSNDTESQPSPPTTWVDIEDEFADSINSLLNGKLIIEARREVPLGGDESYATISQVVSGDEDGDTLQWESHSQDDGEFEVFDSELLESQNDGAQKPAAFVATPFGLATFKSAFSIDEASFVSQELSKAQRDGLVLTDELHLCYLVTPINVSLEVNWSALHTQMRSFDEHKRRIMTLVGLDEGLVFHKAMSGMNYGQQNKDGDRIAKRFYNALILCQLINEVPIHEVARHFEVQSRGSLQSLLQSAAMFSSMMVNFCRTMQWGFLEVILQHYAQRIGAGGVKTDLLELMEIDMVASTRARHLFNAGYRNVKSVAEATPRALFAKLGRRLGPHPRTLATRIVQSAQRVLRRKVMLLRREAEQLEYAT